MGYGALLASGYSYQCNSINAVHQRVPRALAGVRRVRH